MHPDRMVERWVKTRKGDVERASRSGSGRGDADTEFKGLLDERFDRLFRLLVDRGIQT